jgi:hypothetical protein
VPSSARAAGRQVGGGGRHVRRQRTRLGDRDVQRARAAEQDVGLRRGALGDHAGDELARRAAQEAHVDAGALAEHVGEQLGVVLVDHRVHEERALRGVSPSGGTVGARIAATGYPARAWGENIAAGYVDPAEAVAGFLASPTHCAVLMDGGFQALGAAFVEEASSLYGSYWTLVFATPQPLTP